MQKVTRHNFLLPSKHVNEEREGGFITFKDNTHDHTRKEESNQRRA